MFSPVILAENTEVNNYNASRRHSVLYILYFFYHYFNQFTINIFVRDFFIICNGILQHGLQFENTTYKCTENVGRCDHCASAHSKHFLIQTFLTSRHVNVILFATSIFVEFPDNNNIYLLHSAIVKACVILYKKGQLTSLLEKLLLDTCPSLWLLRYRRIRAAWLVYN